MKLRQILSFFMISVLYGSTVHAQNWSLTNGPSGSRVRSILVDDSDVYVVGKTVLRSADAGVTWDQLVLPHRTGTPKFIKKQSDGDLYVFLQYVVSQDSVWHVHIERISGQDSNNAVYDTIRSFLYVVDNYNRSGVYRSTDGGQSWSHVFGLYATNTMFIDANDRIMLITDRRKQYTSTDDGMTWDSSVTAPEWSSNLFQDASGDIFLTTARGVFRSTTNGASWSKAVNGIGDLQYHSMSLDVGGVHYVTGNGGTYKSSDDGRSWEQLLINGTSLLNAPTARNSSGMIMTGNNWDSTFHVSTDNGSSWNSFKGDYLALNFGGNDVYNYSAPCVGGPSNDFYSGGEHGFWRVTATSSSELGIPIGSVLSLIALQSGTVLATTASESYGIPYGTLWRSTDEGATWVRSTWRGSGVPQMAMDSAGNGFVTTYNGLLRTTDDGVSWSESPKFLTMQTLTTGLAVGGDGTIYLSTYGEYMFRSTDNGLTWDQLNYGLSESKLTSIAVSPNNDVYASSEKNIYRSTDAGITWSATTFTSNARITAIVVSPQGRVLAGTATGGVLSSTDDGATWTDSGSGLDSNVITRMLSTPSGKIIAGTDNGVYVLNPGSNVWNALNNGLSNPSVLSLTRALDGRVYVGTDGTGVFKSSQTYNIMQSDVAQEQNSAPFGVIKSNESLNFRGLSGGTHEVTLYDVLGRVVLQSTINGSSLDVSDVPTGTYFVKIGEHVAPVTL